MLVEVVTCLQVSIIPHHACIYTCIHSYMHALQAHRAPVALQTLSSCFRCLMYPQPLLLKYLPDVLRLSLAGIEPSDVRKTALVLHLYSTILAWLPTTSTVCPDYCSSIITSTTLDDDNNEEEDAPSSPLRSYIELIEKGSSRSSSTIIKETTAIRKDVLIRVELSSSEISDQFEVLSQYMSQEWCDALLKKFFALLEAQEAEVEGAAQSPLTGMHCTALHCCWKG